MLKLVGVYGSPYSLKICAVGRYRRIPFPWILRGSHEDVGIPATAVQLMPVMVFPGSNGSPDSAMIDSTPQIRRLEQLYQQRCVDAPDPALRFVDMLIEDYADEWMTKQMFHYRWSYAPNMAKAGRILALYQDPQMSADPLEQMAGSFSVRQIPRLDVVGSNTTTRPVIEESYRGILGTLDHLIRQQRFVMG